MEKGGMKNVETDIDPFFLNPFTVTKYGNYVQERRLSVGNICCMTDIFQMFKGGYGTD